MSTQLAPFPIFKGWDNNGNPLVGGQLFTYQAGTTTPQASWTDATQTVQNTNPVILNSRGEASVWLDPTLTYKLLLQDSLGNTIPGYPVDQVVGGYLTIPQLTSIVTTNYIGQLINPVTAAETAAGVTPVNFQYPAYTPDRYVTNGVGVDMFQAITNADKAANIAGANVNFLPGSVYGVNCTAHAANLIISSSWVCNGPQATIQRLDFTTSFAAYTAEAQQVSHLTLRGLIFDGQVTAASSSSPNVDIGAIGSFSDNSSETLWSQVYGVIFRQTQYCTIENCVFKNFLRAGLRLDATVGSGPPVAASLGAPWTFFAGGGQAKTGTLTTMLSLGNRVLNCRTQRTRGIFGDGFYTENSENNEFVNCYAYDYQRIGFVMEFGNQTNNYGTNGSHFANCTADFGHDAVTSGAQSNVGFWSESCDGLSMVNCESKNTSVGWVVGSAANASQGTFRPYTGGFTYTGCRAVRCNSSGFKVSLASRDAHVVFQGCFVELNPTAATYSASVGLGSNAFQVSCSPGGSPPDTTSGVSYHIEIRDCHVDLIGMSATSSGNPVFNAAAVNMWQGNVTNPNQLQVDITGLSTKWLTSAGALDPNVPGTYEITTGNNYGYFGDIIFTGVNNGGAAFAGRARIRDCTNQTTDFVMISGEIGSANSLLEVANTRCSFRTGGATNNKGILTLSSCPLVDYRGNILFNYIFASNCFFADADPLVPNRVSWGNTGVGLTNFYFSNCRFQRQMLLVLGSGTSTNVSQSLTLTGCEFILQFPWSGGGENALNLSLGSAAFGNVNMSGNIFRNIGGHSSANGSMIISGTTGTITINGAGNVYDANYVTTGGHVIQYNGTPTFNDAPQTVAAPFTTVNGVKQQFNNA